MKHFTVLSVVQKHHISSAVQQFVLLITNQNQKHNENKQLHIQAYTSICTLPKTPLLQLLKARHLVGQCFPPEDIPQKTASEWSEARTVFWMDIHIKGDLVAMSRVQCVHSHMCYAVHAPAETSSAEANHSPLTGIALQFPY